MTDLPSWMEFTRESLSYEEMGIWLDFSGLSPTAEQRIQLQSRLEAAFAAMEQLEAGAIANPDEGRQVGHYWLRAPELAPRPELREAIETARRRVEAFASSVRLGEVGPAPGRRFEELLMIGIGGSALGPQLVSQALPAGEGALAVHFLDNTDPEGFEAAFEGLDGKLDRTLAVVVSKSGGTPETRNGLAECADRLRRAGLDPARHLVAVTGEGSALEQRAREEGWLEVFPMWDWVGGRTSQTSAVGLLPMSLMGQDVDAFLAGAREMDALTRRADPAGNPAARLAMAWHVGCEGHGRRDMVVIPYRDRLSLLARYLQQLVMESLGKERDLEGRVVRQGLTVYGNKGSTDQHAYVQQLRDGVDNYFLTLIGTLEDPPGPAVDVGGGVTAGDYLMGFLLGTRRALLEGGRRVITIMLTSVDARRLGALIALYERTVGLYASLIGVNAYHQPGVEAGKRAAAGVLDLQGRLLEALSREPGQSRDGAGWAVAAGSPELAVEAHWVLEHLAANRRGVRRESSGEGPVFFLASS